MVVEQSVRCSHYALAVSLGVPGNSEARRHIIKVARNALRNAEEILALCGYRIQRTELRGKFHIVAHAIINGEVGSNPPTVLPEGSQRCIRECVAGIAHALNEVGGNAGSVS